MTEDTRRDAPVLAGAAKPGSQRFAMPTLAVAQIVARNIVPLAGVLFLGWNAWNVVLLYFLDTMLAIAVIFGALISVFARRSPEGAKLGPVRLFATVIFLTAFFAVPLGVPVLMMIAGSNVHWRDLFADPALRIGAIMQAIAAFWSYVELWRALKTATPEQLRIKRRFALVFLRWIGVLMTIYVGIGVLAPLLVIIAYAVLSIWTEIAPDHFLRVAGEREDSDPGASGATPGPAPRSQEPRRKHRHRHS